MKWHLMTNLHQICPMALTKNWVVGEYLFLLAVELIFIYNFWVGSYYYTHDARREVQPPTIVAVNSKNSLKLPPKADSKYKRLI
jgi:hypothetical protein